MKNISKITCFLMLVGGLLMATLVSTGWAQQSRSYELIPYPDLWYNNTDGIRIGSRIIGQRRGTFEDGPHRLNAGVWFSTWLPDYPVSYRLSFIEPIASLSGFNSEANISLLTSLRTGFDRHSVSFNKRWQTGFDELEFSRLQLILSSQRRFDNSYVHYESLWQQERLWLAEVGFILQQSNGMGRYRLDISLQGNVTGTHDMFVQGLGSFSQRVLLGAGFALRSRVFAGLADDTTPSEFRFSRGMAPASQWVDNSLVRAEGTIPAAWFDSGIFQVAGGANLRGYARQDVQDLERGMSPLLTSIGALNLEVDYPNPIDKMVGEIPVLGNFLELRSYIFLDAGTSFGFTEQELSDVIGDAGPGFMFSFNIPDFRGNPRGIFLRYDMPLWLSKPQNGSSLKFRSVIGIGAVFSL